MRSSYHGIRFVSDIVILLNLRWNQIGKDEVTLHIDHESLRLNVSQIYSLLAQVLNDEDHASYIKLGIFCPEQSHFSDDIVQLFSFDKLNQGVQKLIVLECFISLYDEGML